MLTEAATFKIKTNNRERDIRIVPLFLQNHKDPWEPNEIFELLEIGNNDHGNFTEFAEPIETGKIIIDDHKNWRYEGNSELDEDLLNQIAGFVLSYEE